jgi:hypothetical protein
VWLVVSGYAGPATYATAKMVKEIAAELPGTKGHVLFCRNHLISGASVKG